jgi:RNA polymerase sigma-70 factor, ECF subfamily
MNTTRMNSGDMLTQINDWLQGNDHAFEAVFYYYQPRLYRYAFKYLHHQAQAEDITTEILIKTWQKRNAITAAGTFENYLFTVAHHCLVDEWRKRIDILLSPEIADQQADTGTDPFIYKELEATYRECLSGLPEQRRRIFLLHREENLTYNQIAGQLDISPKTVENQISATLKQLRTSLAQYITSLLL